MKYPLIAAVLLCFLFSSCNQTSEAADGQIYVGGQIVNPNSDFVTIAKDQVVIDTMFLDNENRFGKNFNSLKKGIYTFEHHPEHQIMYLEPGDSILIWLNTMEFDESLNFSGTGAEKSGFLIDMFINNEKNNEFIQSYYKLKPSKFEELTDSIKKVRIKELKKLKGNYQLSEEFLKVAEAGINYEFYDLRERYSFLLKKYYSNVASEISDSFFDYRKKVNFNDESLRDYYVYLNFIDDYLRSKSLDYCDKNSKNKKNCYKLNNYENISYRIKLIDSLSQTPSIKQEFLDRLVAQGIIYSNNEKDIDSIVSLARSVNKDTLQYSKFAQMGSIQKNLLPGKNIGRLVLKNINRDTIALKDVSKKPMVTYHWSLHTPDHHKWQHKAIKDLRKKYPDIEFVGINIDKDVHDLWKETLKKYNYNTGFEFQLNNTQVQRSLLKNYLNKLFFVDTNGNIIVGDAQLNTPSFERKLLEFLNN